jgi:hypothetical protein
MPGPTRPSRGSSPTFATPGGKTTVGSKAGHLETDLFIIGKYMDNIGNTYGKIYEHN